MSFPATLATLEAAGYERESYSRCKGCGAAMEWWTTPNGQRIPMDWMQPDNPDSPAVSHFATCPDANRFRKEPQRCTPIYPKSTSQESLLFPSQPSSSPPPPSSSITRPDEPSDEQPKKRSND